MEKDNGFREKAISLTYKNQTFYVLPREELSEYDFKLLVERFDFNLDNYIKQEIDSIEWVYCLVGNIVKKHKFGENKEIKYGSKQFSGGTKVYCYPGKWGDGYERIYVLGRPRKQNRLAKIVIRRELIENFRLKKVFNKKVIKEMYYDNGWDNSEKTKQEIIDFAKALNANINNIDESEEDND
jgi:hypothetical protein